MDNGYLGGSDKKQVSTYRSETSQFSPGKQISFMELEYDEKSP
jgi:hypothetical protein